jgi:hypothetical protein
MLYGHESFSQLQPGFKPKPNQTLLHGFGFGLRILEPKPDETKPKPRFANQIKSEHH